VLHTYRYHGQNNVTGQLPALVGEFPSNAGATWYVPGSKALAHDTNGALGYFA